MIGEIGMSAVLFAAARQGVARARETGRETLVSVAESLDSVQPLDIFAAALGRHRFFWSAPDEQQVAAIGVARAFDAGSISDAEVDWRTLIGNGVVQAAPRLFGALPFDVARPGCGIWTGAPIGRLVLPRIAVQGGSPASATINLLVDSCTDPQEAADEAMRDLADLLDQKRCPSEPSGVVRPDDGAKFRQLVAQAVQAIERGDMQKVVAARAQYLDGTWDPADVLERLCRSFPHCITFAVAADDICFLGATPEWLVRLRNGQAHVGCLAGTAPRGATPEEDEALGAELLASAKNREEHALVLEELLQALDDIAARVDTAPEPRLLKLPNVQHLLTPVCATVPGQSILSLAERLHPTPAVAGYPRQPALAFLREREDLQRGGYAGPVGWVDAAGDGEFAVGLRSALIRGCVAAAFAGGGIVAGSEPESEYQETLLKLRPMLAALGARDG